MSTVERGAEYTPATRMRISRPMRSKRSFLPSGLRRDSTRMTVSHLTMITHPPHNIRALSILDEGCGAGMTRWRGGRGGAGVTGVVCEVARR